MLWAKETDNAYKQKWKAPSMLRGPGAGVAGVSGALVTSGEYWSPQGRGGEMPGAWTKKHLGRIQICVENNFSAGCMIKFQHRI